MDELNQDGLLPNQEVSFEELKRIEAQRQFRADNALKTHLSQQARRKRKANAEETPEQE